MLDFSYRGALERSAITPPEAELEAALHQIPPVARMWADRAGFGWVATTVDRWAKQTGTEIRPLPKVRGRPIISGEVALVCAPDRAGFAPPPDWTPPDRTIVIEHVFGPHGDLREIRIAGARPAAPMPSLRGGRRLAGRLRQVAGVTTLSDTHGAWCSFLQPEEPGVVLGALAEVGIVAGDPLDLPEFAGGIGAVVPASASDGDLDRYAGAVARALG